MRTLVICATVMALALSGAACKKGGGEGGAAAGPCDHKSKCEKEDPMTAEKVAKCKADIEDKDCGAQAKAMIECMIAKETCNAEGKMDDEATMTACAEPFGAYFECMKNKAPAAPPAP